MPLHTRPVSLLTTVDRVDIFVRGERFAAYQYRAGETPGFTGLYAPGERAVTQPAANGMALWLAHGDVNGVPVGIEADTQEKAQGAVMLKEGATLNEGASGGSAPTIAPGQMVTEDMTARRGTYSVGFQHYCAWLAPDGAALLRDTRTVRALPGPSEGAILDIEIRLQAPDEKAVTLGRTENALLCLRAASALYSTEAFALGGGQARNSLGEYGATNIHARQARWCAGVGVVQGETVGFAFLEHPGNPWFPSPWIARPDGVLSPSPFGWQSRSLAPGERLTLRYRILVHLGYVHQGWADARLADYAREVRD